MSKNVRRRGFTLPEVLVTITIVAVLAAVVVPAVLNQVSKGDDAAVGQDLDGVRTAITTFTSDVRHYPRKMTQMSGTSLAAADSNIDGNTFGTASAAAYKGPYMQISGSSHVGPTGAKFRNRLGISGNRVCLRDSVAANDTSLVTPVQATQMDKALDKSDGGTLGSVRFTVTGAVVDTGTFFACLVTK